MRLVAALTALALSAGAAVAQVGVGVGPGGVGVEVGRPHDYGHHYGWEHERYRPAPPLAPCHTVRDRTVTPDGRVIVREKRVC